MTEGKEALTPQQFIQRLNISKSTLHNWRNLQLLKRGAHYTKVGRKVLYLWHPGLPEELDREAQVLEKKKNSVLKDSTRPARRIGPNWDY